MTTTCFIPGYTALLEALNIGSSDDILNLLSEEEIDATFSYGGASPLHAASYSGLSTFIRKKIKDFNHTLNFQTCQQGKCLLFISENIYNR